jgi:hypothetical protein
VQRSRGSPLNPAARASFDRAPAVIAQAIIDVHPWLKKIRYRAVPEGTAEACTPTVNMRRRNVSPAFPEAWAHMPDVMNVTAPRAACSSERIPTGTRLLHARVSGDGAGSARAAAALALLSDADARGLALTIDFATPWPPDESEAPVAGQTPQQLVDKREQAPRSMRPAVAPAATLAAADALCAAGLPLAELLVCGGPLRSDADCDGVAGGCCAATAARCAASPSGTSTATSKTIHIGTAMESKTMRALQRAAH